MALIDNDEKKRLAAATWIAIVSVSVMLIVLGIRATTSMNPTQQRVKTRAERIEAQFNAWDGSHWKLREFVKDNMEDPDSFECAETTYWDRGDHLTVRMKFRGKNVFNATVTNTITANVDMDGNIVEILGYDP